MLRDQTFDLLTFLFFIPLDTLLSARWTESIYNLQTETIGHEN